MELATDRTLPRIWCPLRHRELPCANDVRQLPKEKFRMEHHC